MSRTFDGHVANAINQLCRNLLESDPEKRPASASECWEILSRAIPTNIPFRVYFACALTATDEKNREYLETAAAIIRRVGAELNFKVYVPGEHTDPLTAPDLPPREVYWIDRERVASSDLIFILADTPSFGVGQEAEIATNAGVPIALFHSPDAKVSRMLRGIGGLIIGSETFADLIDLETKVRRFFSTTKDRLAVSRRSREREYHLRVGNRVRHRREGKNLTIPELAQRAEMSEDLVHKLETRPEQQSSFSLVNLRRIARALDMPLAELVADQSTKDAKFGELYHDSLLSLRKFAKKQDLSYGAYARLKLAGREQIHEAFYAMGRRNIEGAAVTPMSEKQWEAIYLGQVQSSPVSELFDLPEDNESV